MYYNHFSSMTNSTMGEDILTVKDRLDEERVIGSSSDSNGLYIVSDNIKKRLVWFWNNKNKYIFFVKSKKIL